VCGGGAESAAERVHRVHKIKVKEIPCAGVQRICFWGCSTVRHEILGVHCGKKH